MLLVRVHISSKVQVEVRMITIIAAAILKQFKVSKFK